METNMQKDVKKQNISVNEIATTNVISVPQTMSIIHAAKTMTKNGFRRLPVTDSGTNKIIGIVTATDIANLMGGGDKYNLVSGKHKGNLISALNDSVHEIMSKNLITFGEDSMVEDVAKVIVERKCGGMPIVDKDGVLIGIVTERDILKAFVDTPNYMCVKDAMTKRPHVISPNAPICSVTKEMISKKFRRLPVVSDEVLYGIVTVMDILKHVGNGEVFKEMVTGNASDVMSVPVRNLVSGNLLTTTPEESLTDIANSMLKKNIGAFPVIYNSTLTGIITEFDLVRALTKI